MSTPTVNLRRASRPSQAGAQRNNDEQVLRPAELGGSREEGSWGQNNTQLSNLARFRILRGLIWLDDIVPLPQTLRGYLLFVLALTVVCGLAVFQVWTSLRITQARAELEALSVQYSLIEQKNAELLWQIGQLTTLYEVQSRAVQLDFRPALERNYIPDPNSVTVRPAADASFTESGANRQADQQAGNALTLDQPAAETSDQPALPAGIKGNQGLPQPPNTTYRTGPASTQSSGPASPEPSFWSVSERLPIAGIGQFVTGWQQEVTERWQAVRQWGEPMIERAGDFFLGQLKQPR